MLYFIGIKLPKELEKKVYELKELISVGRLSSAPPHITLVPSFTLKDENKENKILDILKNVFHKRNGFELEIKNFGFFKKRKNNVVYLSVQKISDLIDLEKELNLKLKNFINNKNLSKPKDQNFHITIAKRLSTKELSVALKKIEDLNINVSFQVKEVVLYRIKDNKPWQEYSTFNLDNK